MCVIQCILVITYVYFFFSDEETARCLARILRSKGLLRDAEQGSTTVPAILEGEDGYDVTIDGITVVTVRSLREALVQFALAQYVFNMKVRAVTTTLMWFMSTKILSLPQEGAAPADVVAAVQQLE